MSMSLCAVSLHGAGPFTYNPSQKDSFGDYVGDACRNGTLLDPCGEDVDMDMYGSQCDNCPDVYNPDQLDSNDNGVGDACDSTSS